ncbi:MAG: MarR family transcriptional regulator [Peptococcaceae bacterium]|nr:MarR family transcriptional regulator [Peptococcaceae bacterium]
MDEMKLIYQKLESIFPKYYQFINNPTCYGLTPVEVYLLQILRKKGGCSVTALAPMLGVTPGTVTNLTDRLSSKGYVVRERGEEDRRVVQIIPTEEGLNLVDKINADRIAMLGKVFKKMNENSVGDLVNMLENVDKCFNDYVKEVKANS